MRRILFNISIKTIHLFKISVKIQSRTKESSDDVALNCKISIVCIEQQKTNFDCSQIIHSPFIHTYIQSYIILLHGFVYTSMAE